MKWTRVDDTREGSTKCGASDAQVTERLKERDEGAFLELYDWHGPQVYRFLVHMTGSIAVAEDLTQEVFAIVLDTVLHNRFRGFDAKKGTLEGYLLGIARNLARKEFGRRRRAVPLDGKGMMEKLCRDDQSLNGLVLRQELARLQVAIAELPSHYREVVVLCCLEDRSYEDAARIVECSVGTVASRISRAKQLLTAKLRRAGSAERMLTGREEIRR